MWFQFPLQFPIIQGWLFQFPHKESNNCFNFPQGKWWLLSFLTIKGVIVSVSHEQSDDCFSILFFNFLQWQWWLFQHHTHHEAWLQKRGCRTPSASGSAWHAAELCRSSDWTTRWVSRHKRDCVSVCYRQVNTGHHGFCLKGSNQYNTGAMQEFRLDFKVS